MEARKDLIRRSYTMIDRRLKWYEILAEVGVILSAVATIVLWILIAGK